MADSKEIRRLAVEGDFTIFTAQALKEQFQAALAEDGEIEVDLSNVTEMDSAGLQLMVAAKREAAAHQKSLRFIGHSPAVIAALDLCDLSGHFGDPVLLSRD